MSWVVYNRRQFVGVLPESQDACVHCSSLKRYACFPHEERHNQQDGDDQRGEYLSRTPSHRRAARDCEDEQDEGGYMVMELFNIGVSPFDIG